MNNEEARQIGLDLQPVVNRLLAMVKEARAQKDPEAEALEIAAVNVNSAIEILTE